MQFFKFSRSSTIIYAALLAFVNPIQSLAADPPPPVGPPAPILTGITLSGPSIVDEQTNAQYTCIGKYSDLTTAPVDSIWEVNTADASIDDVGLLRVGSLSSDQNISITASVGGYSETLDVLIQSVAPVLTGIEIFGPSTVDEEGSAQYACTAYYLDETTGSVVPSWTVSSDVAVIDASGTLTVGRIESDELIRIVASFDGETNSFEVTLRVTADDETSNGTPYSWLLEYGLTEADDHLDTDGDGLLTWEEYIAGTNPTNAASVLIITSNQRLDNGDYVVTWQSVEGKSYSVITNTSLSDPTTGTVASDILGEVNETSYTGTMGSAEAVFYEIGVE